MQELLNIGLLIQIDPALAANTIDSDTKNAFNCIKLLNLEERA